MAKFTTSRPLRMRYAGHDLTGPPGTVHRIPDSLRLSFIDEYGAQMPDLTWVTTDEIAAGGGSHPDLAAHDTLGLVTDAALTAHDGDTNAHVYFALDVDLATHTAAGHPGLYAAASHAHVDADIPAGIARDAEVTAAINNHSATATHGGSGSIPAGIIAMWGGLLANIPAGWALCDGLNGTPDLRDRFIKGAAPSADPGATGGSATHGHTVTQPADHAALTHTGTAVADHAVTQPTAAGESAHTHTYTQVVNHTHPQAVNSAISGGLSGYTPDTSTNTSTTSGYSTGNPTGGVATGTTTGGSSHTHAMSGTAVSAHAVTQPADHAAQSHSGAAVNTVNSEPAYYALAFIQKL